MLPPVFYPGQLLLPCCPQRPEVNHPWDWRGHGAVDCLPGHWQGGQAALFWARGDGGKPERHRLSPQTAAGCSALVLRVLLTAVTCLSNCSQEVSCCSLHCCSSYFCLPCCPLLLCTANKRLPGLLWHLGERLRDSPHTPSPGWLQWVEGCKAAWHRAPVLEERTGCPRRSC